MECDGWTGRRKRKSPCHRPKTARFLALGETHRTHPLVKPSSTFNLLLLLSPVDLPPSLANQSSSLLGNNRPSLPMTLPNSFLSTGFFVSATGPPLT